jgi:hypothetical protein
MDVAPQDYASGLGNTQAGEYADLKAPERTAMPQQMHAALEQQHAEASARMEYHRCELESWSIVARAAAAALEQFAATKTAVPPTAPGF